MAFAGMPTWMHFISAFYSLNMFSSFGVKKATDVQIINSAIFRCACTQTPKCHMIGQLTVAHRSVDSLNVARQRNAVGRWSADHWATVGRMENFVVGEGNRGGMVLM